ncbi:hypothetical protein IFM89_010563, partial [Coptis chinensis]
MLCFNGQKLLEVIKKGLEYIAFAAIAKSALPSLKLMLVGLHVAN